MKRTTLILLIIGLVITCGVLIGCADAAVKTAISDFQNAINNNSPSQLKNALSPDSDYYITQGWDWLLTDVFGGNTPVYYSNYTITVSGADADSYANATYAGLPVDGGVWFWFKRDNTFLSFLFPSYKVYRYYQEGDWSTPVWRKPETQTDQ